MNREELVAAYTAPDRLYHNLAHIEDCLAALARVDGLSVAEREILTEAIWWHDVVTIRPGQTMRSAARSSPNETFAPRSARRLAA